MFGFTSTVQETPTSATSPDVYPTRHPSYASTLMPEPPSSREVGSDRGVLPRLGSLQAIPTSSGPASTSGAESVSSGTIDEVTTVFVVGFPDDVTEREFQNMFTFAEGFEAASLTVPSQSGEDSSARPTQEEAPPFSGLPQYIIQATRDPFALPRELGGAVTNVTSGGGATTGPTPRKQIIGFARFCSRQHALAAAEVLSGRKIDPEKAMVLKAEMAKKNLHFRKSLLPPSTTGTDSPAPIAASAVVDGPTGAARPATGASSLAPSNGPQVAPGQGSFPSEMRRHPSMVPSGLEAAAASVAAAATSAASAMGGSGPSIPLSALDSATLAKLASVSNLNPAVLAEIARQSALAGGPVQKPAPGPDQGYEARGRSRSYRQGSFEDYAAEPSDVYSESITASSSTASQPRSHSSAADAAFGYALPQQSANEADHARFQNRLGLDQAALVAHAMLRQQQSQTLQSQQRQQPPQPQQQMHQAPPARDSRTASYLAFPSVETAGQSYSAAPLQSPPLAYAIPRSQNPADMNAPKK